MILMDIENLGTISTSLVSGTVLGILIGYAVKKILRIGLIILGIFFAGTTYLQFQGLLTVNWEKLEMVSKNTLTTVLESEITGNAADSVMTNLGLPLTGGMAMGFAFGFMKG
jgi:uncharacterized membrane protein (Fun14 family)